MLVGKLIVAVFNTKKLFISQNYKVIIAAPAIRMDTTFKLNAAPDDTMGGGKF